MSKTVFVAGGAGYIGSTLCETLLNEGHTVRLLDRFFFGRKPIAGYEDHERLTVLREDTRYVSEEALKGVDVVMDLSGISNDPSCDLDAPITLSINVDGTKNLARVAKAAGVPHYIFTSSCSVYGTGEDLELREDSPKHPVSLYAKTKIDAEEALLAMADDTFSVTFPRLATVYGVSHRMRFDLVINIMTLYAYENRKIYVLGGGKQWRPLVHVRDVARAFLAIMDAPREKVHCEAFNVGSNEQNYQIVRVAQMVRDVVPYTEVEIVPDDPDKRSYNVCFDKIGEVLGYETTVTPYEGIVEVKQGLERGQIEDTIHTRTVNYYKYLLEAERVIQEVSYNGSVF